MKLAEVACLHLYFCLLRLTSGLKFVNEKKHLQLKRGDDAVFDFSFIVDSGETVKEVFFGYDGSKEINQIIAVHTGNLVFNPKLNVSWSNKVDITVDLTSTAKLVLSKVTEKSLFDITFFCKIKYTVGAELIEKKSKIKLEIVYEPKITALATSPLILHEKTTSYPIKCVATGKPTPNVTWYKQGNVTPLTEGNGIAETTFNAVNREQAGNYTCKAQNVAGIVESVVEIVVYYKPEINEADSSTELQTFIHNYQPIYLKCVADGIPEPTYKWNSPTGYEIGGKSTYPLQYPGPTDFGKYECRASNKLGVAQHFVEVKEIGKPQPVNISIINRKSRLVRIVIQFDKEEEFKDLVLSYRPEGGEIVRKSILKNQSYVDVDQLKPFTIYEFNVTVKNEFFESDGQRETLKTAEDAPGPPSNIKVDVLSSYELNASWDLPAEANGVITKYKVIIYEKGKENVSKTHDAKLEKSKLFNGLKPFTYYMVEVQASTKAGKGNWSDPVETQTYPEPPSVPRNVNPQVVDQKTIVVAWKPPSENWDQVSKYQMKLEFTSLDTPIESDCVLLNLTHDRVHGRQYKITTLRPYADYKLSIREGTGDKPIWGNFSEPVPFQMPEGIPNKPKNLKVIDKDYNQIHLTWTRPDRFYGVLKRFSVVVNDTHSKILEKQLKNDTFFYTLQSLEPNTLYKIHVEAHTELIASNPSNKLYVKTTMNEEPIRQTSGGNITAILVGIVAVIIIIIFIVMLFLYVSRRKQLKNTSSVSSMEGFMELARRESSPIHVNGGSRTNGSVANGHIPEEYVKHAQCTFTPLKPIAVTKLKVYVAQNRQNKGRGFIEEFRAIKPEGDFTYNVSMKTENKCKNRYANILAYDHSRVVLNTVENLDESDYVNANYIDGYNRKAKFIATQGPVPAAFNDFWRMVWEQNTYTIVMVTNLIEKSRVKCQKYWPNDDDKKILYGKVLVEILDEIELADHVMRRFKVALMKDNTEIGCRKVTHYQFLSWPDHGVPQYANPLLQFVKRIRAQTNGNVGPIICHCSAGVGHSGTYIVIDAMLDQIEQEKAVDIFGFTTHIRTQRNLMVQTELQYMFIYNAVLESVLCGTTEINTCDLLLRIKHLNSLNPTSSCTYMQEEYDRLGMNINDKINQCDSALLSVNRPKNRFQDKLPFETSRVKLWPYPDVKGSDYMNASFIDRYQQREAFILTQAPLENTIQDFWRMLWEYEVISVVMISSAKERDMYVSGEDMKLAINNLKSNRSLGRETTLKEYLSKAYEYIRHGRLVAKLEFRRIDKTHHCYPYWPVSTEPTLFELLRVQIVGEEEKNGYIKREFRVTNSKNGETRIITHFMYFDWLVDGVPDCGCVLDMVGSLQKTQQQTGNNSIVIHCSDGCGRSGSLAALMYCLERLKLEGVVDVFQTVRTMRTQRAAIVQSLAQYQFIYAAVCNFLDCFSNYANFK